MIDILKKRFTENKERYLGISFEEAEKMGVRLMNEEEYRYLQTLGESDLKTSSWVVTSERIRCLGGAIFVNVGTMKFLHFIMKLIATIVHVAFAA